MLRVVWKFINFQKYPFPDVIAWREISVSHLLGKDYFVNRFSKDKMKETIRERESPLLDYISDLIPRWNHPPNYTSYTQARHLFHFLNQTRKHLSNIRSNWNYLVLQLPKTALPNREAVQNVSWNEREEINNE